MGIGEAIAKVLAQEGANLILLSRSEVYTNNPQPFTDSKLTSNPRTN
jgi:NADP-dependent 3-hydroxy acid dehydrogenase YdfG